MSKSLSSSLLGVMILHLFSRFNSTKKQQRAYDMAEKMRPFDAIIVPGVPFVPKEWDSVMKARVLWSYHLYKNGFARNIIYSGGAVHTPYVEAIIMAQYAEALGIPKEHILRECEAKHSTENIYYSYLLARNKGLNKIALATDPFQSYFLKRFIRKYFKDAIYQLPIVAEKLIAYKIPDLTIDASIAHVEDIEPEPFLKRIKGTLGWNINWGQHN